MATITAKVATATWGSGTNTIWVGDVSPTAADDVVIPSGAVITSGSSSACVCRSLTVQNGGEIKWIATNAQILIGNATGGALTIGATATVNTTIVGNITFQSTSDNSTNGWPITTNGKTLPNVTFNGVGGKWTLQDALTCGTIAQTNGHLDTNSQTIASTGWSQNNGTTTTTLGSTQWSVSSSGNAISFNTLGTHTFTANTAVVTSLVGSGLVFVGRNVNGMSLVVANSNANGVSMLSIPVNLANLTIQSPTFLFSIAASLTITGTFTATGVNSTTNRLLVQSDTLGTPRTITAAAVSLTDVDFMDITGAGAATWSGTRLGDCQGNSGITFQTSRTLYGVAAGNFSSSAMWSLTSGGTAGEAAPLPQDDVYLDAASAAGTYTNNLPRTCRTFTATGFTGTLTYSSSVTYTYYGSFTLSSGMTFNNSNPNWVFAGRGNHTITSNGKYFTSAGGIRSVTFNAFGGTYTLGDALRLGAGTNVGFKLSAGTFNSANYPITAAYDIESTSTTTRTLNFGTSTVTIDAAGIFNFQPPGLTVNASDATFVHTLASTSSREFRGGGFTYGTVTYTVANSPGALVFTGANTINTLNIGAGRQVTFPANTVTRIGDLNLNGTARTPVIESSNGLHSITNVPTFLESFDIRIRLYLPNWTTDFITALTRGLLSPNMSMYLTRQSEGWYFYGSYNGTAWAYWNGNAFKDNLTGAQTAWIRVTRNAANGQLCGYKATDLGDNTMPSSWTHMQHSPQTATGTPTGTLFNTTVPVTIGTGETGTLRAQTNFIPGMIIHRAQIRNNILDDGSGIIMDMYPSSKTFMSDAIADAYSNTMTVSSGALAGDGRVLLRSSTSGTGATVQITGAVEQHGKVDIQDVVFNGTNAFLDGQTKIRSGVKGIRRSPRYGLMV